jgi:WhiB family redox-sensing transcriptional regulator
MTRRDAVLAHLAEYPDLTAGELARAIGARGSLHYLLHDMTLRAELVATEGRRPGQGHPVSLWRLAPPGTVPPPPAPPSAASVERDRARSRSWKERQRASRRRARVVPTPDLPTGAACAGADPDLFFGPDGERQPERDIRERKAKAVCASCPIRVQCLDWAIATRAQYGIWGGVDIERETDVVRRRRQEAS